MNTEQSNAIFELQKGETENSYIASYGNFISQGRTVDEAVCLLIEIIIYNISKSKIDEPIKVFNVSDNCNAFRNWLRENNIPFISNGAFTAFDLKEDIFSIGKKYGVYEYLNKPPKAEPVINEAELQKDMDEWDEQNKHRSGQAQIDLGNMGNFSSSYEPIKDEEYWINKFKPCVMSYDQKIQEEVNEDAIICLEIAKLYAASKQNNVEAIELERKRLEGVLLGLKICKEMWAQGTISHENIYEHEILYKEELEKLPNQ